MSTSSTPAVRRPPSTSPSGDQGSAHALVTFGRMIKFSHTIFAMPFALAAALLAARGVGLPWQRVVAIVVAMAGARTAAMGFNRIVDRGIDARNPRTANRELPRGAVSVRSAWALTALATVVFLAAAAYLGRLCLALSPIALLFLFGYSYTKRFTALCHVVLGLAIGAGPAGAWIAVRGDFGWAPALLMLAVTTWIAGFDVLYALADRDFDRGAGLHSIPAAFGVAGSLWISGALHLITVGALVALGSVGHLHAAYAVGVAAIVLLLLYEHALLRPSDLSKLDMAFFNLNGYVSVAFVVAVALDVWVGAR